MTTEPQDDQAPAVVLSSFATPIFIGQLLITDEQRQAISARLIADSTSKPSVRISNRGGWHSAEDLLDDADPVFDPLWDAVLAACDYYTRTTFTRSPAFVPELVAWAVVSGPGHYATMHNHPGALLSGVAYLQTPNPDSAQIVFRDPRPAAAMYVTPAMRRLGVSPSWMTDEQPVRAEQGSIVIFSGWLQHGVEPFESPDPDARRIAVAFNLTVADA